MVVMLVCLVHLDSPQRYMHCSVVNETSQSTMVNGYLALPSSLIEATTYSQQTNNVEKSENPKIRGLLEQASDQLRISS
jgi:hypothetical protein